MSGESESFSNSKNSATWCCLVFASFFSNFSQPLLVKSVAYKKAGILQDYLWVRIGFNKISKTHTLPIVCTMLVKIR